MSDLVMIVPGITGSVLSDTAGETVWKQSARLIVRSATRPVSSLTTLQLPPGLGDADPEGPAELVATELAAGWHVLPGVYSGSGYRDLLRLASALQPGCVKPFPYDWRLSNRNTARRLAHSVDRLLGRWREHTHDPDARVSFVCHSMGGLAVRYFLEVLGGWDVTNRVVTAGTPFSGSVKAVRALTGEAFASIPYLGDQLTELCRSMPAIAQLLPTYNCVHAAGTVTTLSDVSVPDLPRELVAEGRRFHAEIADAVHARGRPEHPLDVIVGTHQPTLQSISLGANATYLREQRGVDHGGDGTVATFSAVPPEWRNSRPAHMMAVRHGEMGCSLGLTEEVRNKLSPVDLGRTLHAGTEFGIDVPDIVGPDEDVAISAVADRSDILLRARLRSLESRLPDHEMMVRPAGSGRYHATVSLPEGLWRVDVEAIAEHRVPAQTGYVCVW